MDDLNLDAVDQSWEHDTRKLRVSCFVYIDTNSMIPSQNSKQTQTDFTNTIKHEKLKNSNTIVWILLCDASYIAFRHFAAISHIILSRSQRGEGRAQGALPPRPILAPYAELDNFFKYFIIARLNRKWIVITRWHELESLKLHSSSQYSYTH